MGFYSYLWLRTDGFPYYAGKGSGNRAFSQYRNPKPPQDHSRILVFPMLTEAEAFESEIALIDLFGRKDLGTGCLINRSDGGDCPPSGKGCRKSPEHVAKVAAANRGKHHNVSWLIEWHLTHPQTPEWKAKVAAARKRQVTTPEARLHMREAQQRHKPTFANRKHTPEAIAKQSAARKAYWERKHACL